MRVCRLVYDNVCPTSGLLYYGAVFARNGHNVYFARNKQIGTKSRSSTSTHGNVGSFLENLVYSEVTTTAAVQPGALRIRSRSWKKGEGTGHFHYLHFQHSFHLMFSRISACEMHKAKIVSLYIEMTLLSRHQTHTHTIDHHRYRGWKIGRAYSFSIFCFVRCCMSFIKLVHLWQNSSIVPSINVPAPPQIKRSGISLKPSPTYFTTLKPTCL